MHTALSSRLLGFALSLALAACGGGGGTASTSTPPPPPVLGGQTSFISADYASTAFANDDLMTAVPAAASAVTKSDARTVAEGDIYAVLESGKTLLNLSSYRGVQVIDISDPLHPTMLGRAALNGTPVEMYRSGNFAYVLVNYWNEYRRASKGGADVLDHYQGAAVMTVDVSNRSAPRVTASMRVPGYIQTSRLTSGNGKSSLYLAINDATAMSDNSGAYIIGQTTVQSFSIGAQGVLEKKGTLSLGGYIQAIAATESRLMVARGDANAPGSRVAVIDISSPDGVMVQGGDAAVSGTVQKKTNMHIAGTVLRVVSSNSWASTSNTNHVESYDIADIAHPKAIDHDTFGNGQQLFGTTFLPDRAFFVTYLRKDPFHAFSITADGQMQERSEFVVSGWNDFFFPVQANARLVGVGFNDANSRRALSVSLYNVSDLSNPTPLLARADIDLATSWSEANFDDRAFRVLENATSIIAPDGKTVETGLVLLPFTGYDNGGAQYQSGVQVFTFSATTLTRRGVMNLSSDVRRSFIADASQDLVANLSDSQLGLFNLKDPANPAARGTLALAPSYSQFVAVGGVGVRYHDGDNGWWGNNAGALRKDTLEIVPLADADNAAPLASITVASGARIHSVGGKLVVLSTDMNNVSTIDTYDLSTPSKPQALGHLVTSSLPQNEDVRILLLRPCGINAGCGPYVRTPSATVVGNALVFTSSKQQMRSEAPQRYWTSYTFTTLDLGDMGKPVVRAPIVMASEEEAIGVVFSGSTLWVNYKKPGEVNSDGLAQARYYVKTLDLSVPSAPAISAAINVPGELKAVNGNDIYTIDHGWTSKIIEHSIKALTVSGGLAYQQASYKLANGVPSSLAIDSKNVVLSTNDFNVQHSQMVVLNAALVQQAALDIDLYTTVKFVQSGRAVLQAPGGLLVYDLSTPAAPGARAYFATSYYSANEVMVGADLYIAAGAFGVYQFKLDVSNLAGP
ncbi:MAG: beta-propeller domain-containing protein [Pseudomonadota bacterium]